MPPVKEGMTIFGNLLLEEMSTVFIRVGILFMTIPAKPFDVIEMISPWLTFLFPDQTMVRVNGCLSADITWLIVVLILILHDYGYQCLGYEYEPLDSQSSEVARISLQEI
jgi:hypothetical protein